MRTNLTLRPSAARGYRETYTEFRDRWSNIIVGRENFKAASVTGGAASPYTDQLPMMYAEVYKREAFHENQFVIYSYSTPIAWLKADGSWTVPAHKYSVTTSKHQSHVLGILSYMRREVHSI